MKKTIKWEEKDKVIKNNHKLKEAHYVEPGICEFITYMSIQITCSIVTLLFLMQDRLSSITLMTGSFWVALIGIGTGVVSYFGSYGLINIANVLSTRLFHTNAKIRMLNEEEIISCTFVDILFLEGVLLTVLINSSYYASYYYKLDSSQYYKYFQEAKYYKQIFWDIIALWLSSLAWWDYSKGNLKQKVQCYPIAFKKLRMLIVLVIIETLLLAVTYHIAPLNKVFSTVIFAVGNFGVIIICFFIGKVLMKGMNKDKRIQNLIKYFDEILKISNKDESGDIEKYFEIYDVVDKMSYFEVLCAVAVLNLHGNENKGPEDEKNSPEQEFYNTFCSDSLESIRKHNFLMGIFEEAKERKGNTI